MSYKKYFTLSYDDGVLQDQRLVEIFNRYHLRCTFNINSGLLGTENTLHINGTDIQHNKLRKEDVATIYAGHEIATHSKTHPDLTRLKEKEIRKQIQDDAQTLSSLCGYTVTGHAYPGGTYDERTADILKSCGIRYARTIDSTHCFSLPKNELMWHPTCHHSDPQIFDLLDGFINAQPTSSDLLFYLWGHSYEFDLGIDRNHWGHIEDICKRIANRDDIIYCTNIEFLNRQ